MIKTINQAYNIINISDQVFIIVPTSIIIDNISKKNLYTIFEIDTQKTTVKR